MPADPTPPPDPAPSPKQLPGALFDLGFNSGPKKPIVWQPPSVEELQQALTAYEVTAFVARGGMGAVYKGMQKALKRTVAIKVLPPEIEQGDVDYAERFKREAQAMAQLSHPGIVAVHDAGETPSGLLYFVMEFVEGSDVSQVLVKEGKLHPARALKITSDVLDALGFAHESGILHRDIKPSNVMLDTRGRVKVADFGLAKVITHDSAGFTRSDLALGTADFIAPEALIPGTKLDARADLYAVGVMLYQMLTGKIPRGSFDPPSGVVEQIDPRIDAIVLKAMKTDREKRYASAAEMRAAIETMSVGQAYRLPEPERPKAGQAKRPTYKVFIAAAIIGITATAYFLFPKSPEVRGSAATSRVAVQPAALHLWNSKDQLPIQQGVSWENDAIKLENTALRYQKTRYRDVILRVRVSADPKLHANVAVRSQAWRSDGERQAAYSLAISSDATQLEFRVRANNSSNLLQSWPVLRRAAPTDWLLVELKARGDAFSVSVDGQLLGTVHDNTLSEPGLIELVSHSVGLFKDVEVIPLDGVPEAEALKRAGISTAPTTTQDPYPSTGSGGDAVFPPGIWTRLWTPAEEAANIERKDGDWLLLKGNSHGRRPPFTNVGVRAQFRGQRVKEDNFPQFNLRSSKDAGTSLNLYIVPSGDKVALRQASVGKGITMLAEAWLKGRLGHSTQEYTMEFYAIGSTVIGRVNGETVTVVLKEPVTAGEINLYSANADFVRDIEVLNLDGLPEAEALKLAGLSPSTAPVWQRTDFSRLTAQQTDQKTVDGRLHILDNHAMKPEPDASPQDAAMRASLVWKADTADVKLSSRYLGSTETVKRPATTAWYARFTATKVFIGTTDDRDTNVRNIELKPPIAVGDKVTLQFASIGRRHLVWVNGKLVGEVTSDQFIQPGAVRLSSGEAVFDSFEHINLDGLPEAEALKLLGATGEPTSPEPAPPQASLSFPVGRWTKVLTKPEDYPAEWREPGMFTFKEGWITGTKRGLSWTAPREGAIGKNQGIRAKFRRTGSAGSLAVRDDHTGGAFRHYEALASGFLGLRFGERTPEENIVKLAEASSWKRPQRGEEYTLELVVVGNRLFARCNGELVIATDDRIPSGTVAFHIDEESIRDVEVLNLDGLPETEALKLAGMDESSRGK